MDYAAVMERQADREKLLGNDHDGILRTYSRRRSHGHGIGDAGGINGNNGKLQGIKRKTGRLDSMGMGINNSNGYVGEEKTQWLKEEEKHQNGVTRTKRKKDKGDIWNREVEKENNLQRPLSRANDESFISITDDAGDGLEIGRRKRREKIFKAQEPYTKNDHSSRRRQRERGRWRSCNGAENNDYTGATIKRTPLMKEKKKLDRKLNSEQRQGSSRMTKVPKTVRTRRIISPNRRNVDPSGKSIRSGITANEVTIGNDEEAITIENVDGAITQVKCQAKQNGEVDEVEAFRQHVESEKKQLISLLKQAQIEETDRQEEHAKTIVWEAAKVLQNAHSIEDPNEHIEDLTEQNYKSLNNPAFPITLHPHPYRENTTFLLEQSHSLLSSYTTFKEQITHFLNKTGKDVENQLINFMSNRKKKKEELARELGGLYAQADKDIRCIIQREERKMKGARKAVRQVEKLEAEC